MNQRYMLLRKGQKPNWSEMLAIGLGIVSAVAWTIHLSWKPTSEVNLILANIWGFSGLIYYFFSPHQKRRIIWGFCLIYAATWVILPISVFPIVGMVVGVLMSIYIGKDFYQTPKE